MARVIGGAFVGALISASLLGAQTTTETQTPNGTISVTGPDGTVLSTFTPVPQGTPPAVPGQPARDTAQPPKTGTSRIRGRAVASDTGQPLRRTMIRLMSPEIRDVRSTSTDAEGRYEFRDLPAARYTLTATKSGYVTMSYGARSWNQAGRVLTLGERQDADRVDFSLPRGGVITGHVIDEFGDPVVGANVQPLRSQIVNGQRTDMPGGSMATTSDTGEFRIWGLTPGDYHVMVSSQRGFGPATEISDDRTGYAPTYYPGSSTAAEAQNIAVSAGQTASGIDITLTPTHTASVSGFAVDSSGQPMRRGSVSLMPRSPGGAFMGMSFGAQIRADGTFTIPNVASGEYTVRGMIPPSAPGMPAEQLTANVTVAGGDVTGVLLAPVRPIKVTGRITLDPPGGWIEAASIRVSAQPKSPGPFTFTSGGFPPITKDDFTFELSAAPGSILVRAFPAAPGGPTWTLKSVRYDGGEVIDSGLDLSEGRDIDGVEIVLTNRQQVVTGLVSNSKGEPVLDATVTLFPRNPDEWTGPTRHMGGARPDQNGRYSVRTLPPGEYFAVATMDSSRRSSDPRQFYQDLSRLATAFTLTEGETRVVDLKVVVQP